MPIDRQKAEALFFEGTQCMKMGDADGAEHCFRLALARVPDFGEALANLGWLREQAGAISEAEACYRQALDIQPENVQVHLNLGVLLMNDKRLAEAEALNRRALQLASDSPAAWSNLGVVLACMKREGEAERCYRTAIELEGCYAKAHFNLSYVLLRQGRLEEGWRCLEARDSYAVLASHFSCPRWRGESLNGKSVVIGFEAGHGDMIHFCRYALLLKRMGAARVTVVCHPALAVLFGTLSGADEVISFDKNVPAAGWDFWTPVLSLPYFCGTRLDNIPVPIPYLAAEPERAAKWSSLLSESALRVGLAWKGNPLFENDRDRSLPSLDTLVSLGGVSGVQFVSLQKGPGEDEALQLRPGFPVFAAGGDLHDFADAAAVMANLDLVISVDTAMAHLAGALGKPCWVLLPDYRTDWRWLTGRSDSPWYPGIMRLFRQSPDGDWTRVVVAVAEALEKWSVEPR